MSYDPTLQSTRDWVRLLIGDTSDDPFLLDPELDGFIAMEALRYGDGLWVRYLAAADALCALAAQFRTKYKGVSSKSVSKLSISYGGAADMDAKGCGFRALAADLIDTSPKLFAVFRTTPCSPREHGES